ncbi:hypothetical protein [Micromonospora sp. NPDC048898]|uniref:hypothetical protein n=1 Tax=Micromonospora sp. NPDC048898 TaxID=3364260 RepID=UPI00371B1CB1
MTRAMRFRRERASAGISQHQVGNAFVLHPHERLSVEARSLALAVAEDPDNDIVVLDLHDGLPIGTWWSVAAALKRRRRGGIRLVVCGASADTGTLAAQWLCDRLRRPVVTPHGRTIRAAAGNLFGDTAEGSGWVRYRPGRAPAWESQRYPAPPWDVAAARFRPTSAVGAVEPIPAGVWIRDIRNPEVLNSRWQWLVAAVPCQPAAMTVVLGCPDTPPLAVDDIARFWRELDPDGRRHARFVQYGPVELPAGEVLGQRLADVLGSPVVCLGGVPVGRPDRTHMYTVTPDGRLGWQVLVRELCFTPRPAPGAAARLPRILSHRAPALLGESVGPMTHRYAPDAVVEIVQSGLWIRADDTARIASRIRARPADPSRYALIIDDTIPSRVPRLRELAEDLIDRLDPTTRARSTLHLASAVAADRRGQPTGRADGDPGNGLTYRFTAADLAIEESIEVALPPAEALATMAAPGPQSPSWVPAATPDTRAAAGVPTSAAAAFVAEPDAAAGRPEVGPTPFGRPPPQTATRANAEGTLGSVNGPTRPVAPPSPLIATPPPASIRVTPHRTTNPPVVALLRDRPEPIGTPTVTPVVSLADRSLARGADRSATPQTVAPTEPPPGPSAEPSPEHAPLRPADQRPVRFQTTPAPDAQGLPTSAGLDAERSWLRQRFSTEFDATASSISRLIAEHPRLHGCADSLIDTVAVRLYLSAPGEAVDSALRSGAAGDGVYFARCVAAGLARLPAHRGAACLAATLSGDDLREIAVRGTLTEWGFTHAMAEPPINVLGNVDVLLWSMTARRTRLLEPPGDQHAADRVLFLPGTRFKVLDVTTPARDQPGRLLLRELSADERVRDGGPFDGLALTSLLRCHERWVSTGRRSRVGAAAVPRFARLPGTV